METRPQWIADQVKAGSIDAAEALARDLPEHVPSYDWEPLLALVARLDAGSDPRTQALYGLLDAAVTRGVRRIPITGSGIRMPIPD